VKAHLSLTLASNDSPPRKALPTFLTRLGEERIGDPFALFFLCASLFLDIKIVVIEQRHQFLRQISRSSLRGLHFRMDEVERPMHGVGLLQEDLLPGYLRLVKDLLG